MQLASWIFEIFTYPYSILFIVIRGIMAPWVVRRPLPLLCLPTCTTAYEG